MWMQCSSNEECLLDMGTDMAQQLLHKLWLYNSLFLTEVKRGRAHHLCGHLVFSLSSVGMSSFYVLAQFLFFCNQCFYKVNTFKQCREDVKYCCGYFISHHTPYFPPGDDWKNLTECYRGRTDGQTVHWARISLQDTSRTDNVRHLQKRWKTKTIKLTNKNIISCLNMQTIIYTYLHIIEI